MAAFDVVAGGAVADIPLEGGVLVFAPAASAIAITTFEATVRAGASALPPAAAVTITAPAASINAGVLLDAPAAAAVTITAPAASVQISATVAAPAPSAVTLTAPEAFVIAGGVTFAGTVTVTVTAPTAAVYAGKSVAPPTAAVTITAPTAAIAISATIPAPVAGITITAPEARAVGGFFIDASNDLSITVNGGMVAGDSVAEYPVADGHEDTVVLKVPPRIVILTPAAAILAGASVFAPTNVISLMPRIAEINARRRKLRLMAIAS